MKTREKILEKRNLEAKATKNEKVDLFSNNLIYYICKFLKSNTIVFY